MLDETNLVINVAKKISIEDITGKDLTNYDDRWRSYLDSIFVAIYTINLDQETKVKTIKIPEKNSSIIPYSVSDGGKIAFLSSEKQSEEWIFKINWVHNGKINSIPHPTSVTNRKPYELNSVLNLKNDLLLIASTTHTIREAWLINLKQPERETQKIETNVNASIGITTAISEEFVVIGETSGYHYYKNSKYLPRTLIQSLKNGSTKTLDGYGSLKLDKNILLRIRSRRKNFPESDVIEVFRLGEDATPHLIKKRKGLESALVHNNLLATVQKIGSSTKICIETLH